MQPCLPPRLRLSLLQTPNNPLKQTAAAALSKSDHKHATQHQHRIFRSSAVPAAAARRIPHLRSPHNWSHIAHRARAAVPTNSGLGSLSAVTMDATALNPAQARGHMGHSHGHGHSHDNTFLTSKNKNDPGVRITRIGLYVNLGMAIVKGFGGYTFNSQA